MADPNTDDLAEVRSRSELTIRRVEGTRRPPVGRGQLMIWNNLTADDYRILFRGVHGKVFEISGAYEV